MRDGDYEAAFLDVRLGAIAANYRAYQRLAGPAAIAGMVKADAYGLGAGMVAPALADDRLYRVGAAYEAARGPLPTAV